MISIDVRKVFLAALRRKLLLIYPVAGFALLGGILGFIIPRQFTAEAKILPPLQENLPGGAAMSVLASEIGVSDLRVTGLGQTPSLDVFVAILRSRTIVERVVTTNDFTQRLGRGKKGRAVSALRRATDIGFSPEAVTVRIVVRLPRPDWAAAAANEYVRALDRFLQETNMTGGRNTRRFVEGRLAEANRDLARAEDSLRVFQLRHKTVVLDAEATEAIRHYAELSAQAVAKEVELNVVRSYATSDNPLYVNTERELNELRQELEILQERGTGAGLGVPLGQMPTVGQEYARRLRDVRIQEQVHALLTQQFEQAKILEARDTPVVVVLEAAAPPNEPSWPKKKLLVMLFAVVGLLVGAALVWGAEYYESLRSRPRDFQVWQEFWRAARAAIRLRTSRTGRSLKNR